MAGRPTEFRPEYVQIAEAIAQRGATDMELADAFDVSVRTIYAWKHKHPEFLQALKVGKFEADSRVERSLYQRAVGFEHDAVKIFCGKDGEVTQVPYREYVVPDTAAASFWLKNRKPDEWRDKVQQEHTGADGGPIQAAITVEFVKSAQS